MVHELYCLYDLKTDVFFPPGAYANDDHAKREFQRFARRGGPVAEFPMDYEVFRVGSFDDATGATASDGVPRLVCRMDALLKSAEDPTKIPFGEDPTGRTCKVTGKGLSSGKEKK